MGGIFPISFRPACNTLTRASKPSGASDCFPEGSFFFLLKNRGNYPRYYHLSYSVTIIYIEGNIGKINKNYSDISGNLSRWSQDYLVL